MPVKTFSRAIPTYPNPLSLHLSDLNGRGEKSQSYSFWCGEKSHASLVRCSSLYETNSSIKQLFKLPLGSSAGCKIYEQQYKQTVDGSKRVPEAAGRESLAITTQSITSSTRHIQPQAPRQHIQSIFPHSHDRSPVIISFCGSGWCYMCKGMQACNPHMLISLYLQCLGELSGDYSREGCYVITRIVTAWQSCLMILLFKLDSNIVVQVQ